MNRGKHTILTNVDSIESKISKTFHCKFSQRKKRRHKKKSCYRMFQKKPSSITFTLQEKKHRHCKNKLCGTLLLEPRCASARLQAARVNTRCSLHKLHVTIVHKVLCTICTALIVNIVYWDDDSYRVKLQRYFAFMFNVSYTAQYLMADNKFHLFSKSFQKVPIMHCGTGA